MIPLQLQKHNVLQRAYKEPMQALKLFVCVVPFGAHCRVRALDCHELRLQVFLALSQRRHLSAQPLMALLILPAELLEAQELRGDIGGCGVAGGGVAGRRT